MPANAGTQTSVRRVTFSQLGLHGRLGNHLWQISAVIGHAERLGLPIRLPAWQYQRVFSLPEDWFGPFMEGDVEVYDLIDELPRDARFVLQDCSHWWASIDVVRRCLAPAAGLAEYARRCVDKMGLSGPLTAVHVRRGDYLKFPGIYRLPTVDYYAAALEGRPADEVLVFTDDPTWVRENFGFLGSGLRIALGNPNFVDLAIMAQCRRHVIANSSFSWWGALLSGADDVVYPAKWYSDDSAHLGSGNMTPAAWRGAE
jgi:hypothetical protein